MGSKERVEIAERVCAAMEWKIKDVCHDDVVAYVPLDGKSYEAKRVLSHDVAAVLRAEVRRRYKTREFGKALDAFTYSGWDRTVGDETWRIANASPDDTARAFLEVMA